MGGKFILRIETTTKLAARPESDKMILDALRWLGAGLGLKGPECWCEYGPYRQSERGDIYGQYALELGNKGMAFLLLMKQWKSWINMRV